MLTLGDDARVAVGSGVLDSKVLIEAAVDTEGSEVRKAVTETVDCSVADALPDTVRGGEVLTLKDETRLIVGKIVGEGRVVIVAAVEKDPPTLLLPMKLVDTLPVEEGSGDWELDCSKDAVCKDVTVAETEPPPVAEGAVVADPVEACVTLSAGLCDAAADNESVDVVEGVTDGVGEGVGDGDDEAVKEVLGVGEGEGETEGVTEVDTVTDGVSDPVNEEVGVGEDVAFGLDAAVPEPLTLGVTVGVPESETVSDDVALLEGVLLIVGDTLAVGELEGVPVIVEPKELV